MTRWQRLHVSAGGTHLITVTASNSQNLWVGESSESSSGSGIWAGFAVASTLDHAFAIYRNLVDAGIQYFAVGTLIATDLETIHLLADRDYPRGPLSKLSGALLGGASGKHGQRVAFACTAAKWGRAAALYVG